MAGEHEAWMRAALEEAERAAAEGNVGVGSVVVRDGALVARGRNLVNSGCDPTAHAETVALRAAATQLGTPVLEGCTLYTTCEPCPMCAGALLAARIGRLVMGARYDPALGRWGAYTVEDLLALTRRAGDLEVVTGVLVEPCAAVFTATATGPQDVNQGKGR